MQSKKNKSRAPSASSDLISVHGGTASSSSARMAPAANDGMEPEIKLTEALSAVVISGKTMTNEWRSWALKMLVIIIIIMNETRSYDLLNRSW